MIGMTPDLQRAVRATMVRYDTNHDARLTSDEVGAVTKPLFAADVFEAARVGARTDFQYEYLLSDRGPDRSVHNLNTWARAMTLAAILLPFVGVASALLLAHAAGGAIAAGILYRASDVRDDNNDAALADATVRVIRDSAKNPPRA